MVLFCKSVLEYFIREAVVQRCSVKRCSENFQKTQRPLASNFTKTLLYAKLEFYNVCFICEFPEYFQNSFFTELLRTTVSVIVLLFKFIEATNYILTYFFNFAEQYVC